MTVCQYIVRNVALDDIEQLYALEQICSQNPWTRGGLEEELSNPDSLFLAIEDDSKKQIVGFVCALLVVDDVEIREVAVHPDYRNKGLGAMLIKSMLSIAISKNAIRAILEVRVSNHPAIKLYEKCGFARDGVRKGYYQDGEDAVLMSMKINLFQF